LSKEGYGHADWFKKIERYLGWGYVRVHAESVLSSSLIILAKRKIFNEISATEVTIIRIHGYIKILIIICLFSTSI